MNQDTGQSEELGTEIGSEVEKNGELNADAGANGGGGEGHEGDGGDQGSGQSKSQSAKQRLRRKWQESEAERARLAEDNRKQGERIASLESKVDGVLNPPKPRPSRVDFESEDEYEDSLYAWRQEENTRQQKANTESRNQQPTGNQPPPAQPGRTALPQKTVDNWIDRCDVAAEKYEDFDEVLNNKSVPISGIMADTMMEAPGGAEAAYFLGKNPTEAAKIAGLSLPQQVLEVQKLTSKFAPSTTNAPEPIDVPSGGGDEASGGDPEKMSPTEYRNWRRQQKAARN